MRAIAWECVLFGSLKRLRSYPPVFNSQDLDNLYPGRQGGEFCLNSKGIPQLSQIRPPYNAGVLYYSRDTLCFDFPLGT